MKKVLFILVLLFTGMYPYCYGQDVKVNINNQDYSSNNDCDFKISGICSSEDIGGVDVEFRTRPNGNVLDWGGKCFDLYAVVTNYNTFPVTVLCVTNWGSDNRNTHSIVLGVNGVKEIKLNSGGNWIEESRYRNATVEGIIVRRLAQ